MKKILFCTVFLPVLFALSVAAAQSISISPPSRTYNRFLVADLGLGSGGRPNNIFTVAFGASGDISLYRLHIEVYRSSDGRVLASGNTDYHPYDTTFSGRSFRNYEIVDRLGGSFRVSEEGGKLQDQVLATGAFPEGSFRIEVDLEGAVGDSADMTITIDPPYLTPIYPIDASVTRSMMSFIWRTNLTSPEFRLYTDPGGRNEIISGARLPVRNAGQRVNGSRFSSLLTPGESYYWQVNGNMVTSHGTVLVRGPLTRFRFVEAGTPPEEGLSEADKAAIMEELIEILRQLVGKRAANSVAGYLPDRVLLDNGEVSVDEIMAILPMIRSGEVEVSSIYFR